MKTITAMKDDVAILLKKLGDMRTVCTNENREANEEERTMANSTLSQIDELEANIALEERTQRTIDRSKSSPEPDKAKLDGQTEQEKRDSFASPGEFYRAVIMAGTPGQPIDPRLSTRAGTGLSEGIPSDGGFLVDQEMASGVLKETWNTGMILPRVNKMTLSGNKNGIKINGLDETSRASGSRAGGIVAYWKGEGAEKTASQPKFRQINLSLNKLIGLCYATDELLDDAQALAQTINEGFRDEFNFKITDAIIRGSGAGQPLGILNSGCLVTVGAETGQDADTIIFENVQNMWSRIKADSRPNAIWTINQDCEPQMGRMSLAVGTGGVPVYMPAGGAAALPYATLFGRPVVPIEQAESVGTVGDIMLCDFSKYKAIDKGGIQSDVSIHVQFIYDEQVFRFVYRFDGQPILGSAITPYKGTLDISHFVALATR